ncbi:syntaxin-like [Schistocerca americana]|uniref:syntaxin-like n=1 Tax=Schistocerca americana TaxID=7009 RepID=UPI001F4F621F|nr:syntaxin-like [Schistocerca americana]
MVKDRIKDLKSVQQGKDYGTVIVHIDDKIQHVDAFLEKVSQIQKLIENIKTKIDELKNIQKELLGIPKDQAKLRQDMDACTASIQRMITLTNARLKEMEEDIKKDQTEDSKPKSVVLRNIEKVQYSSLVHMFSAVYESYAILISNYKDKSAALLKQQLRIKNVIVPHEELEELLAEENPALFSNNILALTAEAKMAIDPLQSRHRELLKIEKSVREMRDQFVELGTLIERQGATIDCIEYFVLHAEDNTENAKRRMQKLKKKKKKRRNLMCKVIAGAIIVFIIVILILV